MPEIGHTIRALYMTDYRLSNQIGVYRGELHRELNPTWLCAVLASQGLLPPRSRGARYLDIGCGTGIDVIALACANPDMHFTGVDPDPQHIGRALELAGRLSLPNVSFIQGGFDDPRIGKNYDYVVAHGLYAWLSEQKRMEFRQMFAGAIDPGGIGVLHYLVEPGAHLWRTLRAILSGLVEHLSVRDALAEMARMAEDKWGVFASLPGVRGIIETISGWPEEVLQHDLLNSHYIAEPSPVLMANLARLGLTFAASADPLANHDVFSLPGGLPHPAPQSRAHRAGLSDIATGRLSRIDIFAPNVQRIPAPQLPVMLDGLSFALMPGRLQVAGFYVPTAFGQIEPAPAMADAVLKQLRQRPTTVRMLVEMPMFSGNLPELFTLLSGMMAVGLVHPLRGIRQDPVFAARFNALAMQQMLDAVIPGPVSVFTGGVISVGSDMSPARSGEIASLIEMDRAGFFSPIRYLPYYDPSVA
ncbi:methyltransferase domain-containing protein [Sinirhodobacter populi]|uniref:Methyltransferase domain-containing protein n=2 Tax=Paenirhodobacter populi TaxID=2306993 RepID=A0A443J765_9RHOB|nr:methyltransferase domain-containing protein [Sinirhodobacter populi]